MQLSAVVLAAGLSSRMGGQPKALLRFDPRDTFVTRIVRTFNESGIHDVVVVVGHEAPRVSAAVRASGLLARCVVNAGYADGQLSSLLAGLDAADASGADGLLLALVDAPAFSTQTVHALVRRFEETRAPVVRAVRGSEHGHPVLIGRALFCALRSADPSRGAKPVVRAAASADGDVRVDDPGAFLDVDTPDDYARYVARRRLAGDDAAGPGR
ncbi:MAG TPA: nucleotidyltransferase family protein [Vicinamibacterales bacterium]|nr:nucleotidyltransferase family protein [Vicinamibacterales bacterium]